MSGINWEAVQEVQDAIESGDKQVYKQQDIASGGSEEFRFLFPTQKDMNGVYFKPRVTFWINEKPYLSLETFGEECPLVEEYEKAQKSKDAEVQALLKAKKFQKRNDYLFCALRMNISYEKDQMTVKDAKVIGEKAVIFTCGRGVFSDVNKIIMHPKNIKAGKGLSILHREFGRNVTIEKTGAGLDTEYSVQLDPDALDLTDEKFDKFYEETPDMLAYLEKDRKDADYLRAIIRNYLYGEELPVEDEEEQEEAPVTKKKGAAKKGKSLLDNLDNLEDS